MAETCALWLERFGSLAMLVGSVFLFAQWAPQKQISSLEARLRTFLSPRGFAKAVKAIPKSVLNKRPLEISVGILFLAFGAFLGHVLSPWGLLGGRELFQHVADLIGWPDTIRWLLLLLWSVATILLILVVSYLLGYLVVCVTLILANLALLSLFFPHRLASYLTKKFRLVSPLLTMGAMCLVLGALLEFVATFWK